MTSHSEVFRSYLKRKGLKLTLPRQQILEAAFSVHDHFTTEQLYRIAREMSDLVSLATVYRTIPLLIEAGLVQQSLRSASRDTYEHILGHPRHIHWICRVCGAVMESDLDELMSALKQDAARLKFNLEEVKVNVSGICWKCQQSEKDSQ